MQAIFLTFRYPALLPSKPITRYVPKIFGFKVHSIAEEHRKQDALRQSAELKKKGMMEE